MKLSFLFYFTIEVAAVCLNHLALGAVGHVLAAVGLNHLALAEVDIPVQYVCRSVPHSDNGDVDMAADEAVDAHES